MPVNPLVEKLSALRDFLHAHLTDSVIPFWLKHAVDEDGGLNTCILDDGKIVNRDKYLWSQWRAVWVFSKLYNQVEKKSEWLDLAEHIADFAMLHGWDEKFGGWRLKVAHDGRELQGCESIYVDAFAIYGLTELHKATGREDVLKMAQKTANHVLRHIEKPDDLIPQAPYPVPPGIRAHGMLMAFSLVFWELGLLLNDTRYQDAALAMADDIFDHFVRPERGLLLERIAINNEEYPSPLGTAVVPGHVIEDMWFQIHIARDTGNKDRIREACRLMKQHVERGWDELHGGLFLAIDADGGSDVAWDHHDTKIWWPHTESLYGLLLAYEQTADIEFLDWYDRIHEYSFSHFPVKDYGEWTQKLSRDGKPIHTVVAFPVKDPFHLPRSLIYCVEVLDRLVAHPPMSD